jgi:4-amino-4-deoxy-L-arabinose transferase-like glycosyltransferase
VPLRAPFAARLVLPVAALELLIQVAFAGGYGYHRDELYFRAAARHPAFGYDDQPPLTPLLGRGSEWLFGETPRGLRVASALAIALVVILVGLLARELGGEARAQFLAAVFAAVSGVAIVAGHLLSTETFDVLGWVAIVVLVARILGGGDPRLWLAVGAVTGVALENKHLPLLLVASLLIALAIERRLLEVLRSPWLWAGAVLALALWVPNLLWQATHGWPQLELADQIRTEEGGENRTLLVPWQLLLVGLPLVPFAIAGLVALLRDRGLRPWRPLGTAYLVLLAILLVTAAKGYYAAPLLTCLLAPGAIVAARWSAGRVGRWIAVGAGVGAAAVLSGFVGLPIVPADKLADTPIPDINEEAQEQVGWPDLVRTVAGVRDSLPPAERARAVVFTENYGEAGAIDRYGPALGIDRAYSGHNANWRFGRPADDRAPVIVLGYEGSPSEFVGCRAAALIDNGVRLENEEQGGTVWLCARPVRPWSAIWPSLRHLDA